LFLDCDIPLCRAGQSVGACGHARVSGLSGKSRDAFEGARSERRYRSGRSARPRGRARDALRAIKIGTGAGVRAQRARLITGGETDSMRVLGIYRERQFSPGKVDADAAILDAVLDQLRSLGFETSAVEPPALSAWPGPAVDLVLAMCQGAEPLRQLSALEQFGAVAINSALAIRNCYRDLLNPGLARAGVPVPAGILVGTEAPLHAGSMLGLEISLPLYVKRGDLHALGPDDVQRVETLDQLRRALGGLAERGVAQAYVQQEIEGRLVKFYGVSGGEY